MTRFSLSLYGLTIAATLAAASVGLAQTAPPTADPVAANAALFYWRAFSLLPNLDKKQEKLLEKAVEAEPVEEALGEVVKLSEPSLRELHRGARQPRCVWATPIEDGVSTLLPHAGKTRQLARIALARAHWNFSRGKPAEGVDDLIAAMTLARHIGADPILITLLVDYAVETMADNLAAADMNRMGPAETKQFAEKFDRLPPATTVSQAVLGERDIFLDPIIKLLSKPGGKEKMFEQFGIVDANDPVIKALKGMSREQLLEGAVGMRPLYEKLAALMELPLSKTGKDEEKVSAWLADPSVKETTRTMAKTLLPGIVALKAEVRQKLCLALLKAAVAVQQHGPEALSNPAYHDPYANAAFQYEKLKDGFRLRSKTPNPRTGKPMSLETGKGLIGMM